jgi:uncharacterized damage-inducible protein DinB
LFLLFNKYNIILLIKEELKEMIERPNKDEFAPYYLSYVNLVSEGEIISILEQQRNDFILMLTNVSEGQGYFRYAPGKWSVKEVIGHMVDTERIMAYRLLCIARGEKASLPGFDENQYVAQASFNSQTIEQLIENYSIVRQSTILLLKSLDTESWIKTGSANHSEITVRALSFIIAGHELHHRHIVNDRYLNSNHYPSR